MRAAATAARAAPTYCTLSLPAAPSSEGVGAAEVVVAPVVVVRPVVAPDAVVGGALLRDEAVLGGVEVTGKEVVPGAEEIDESVGATEVVREPLPPRQDVLRSGK